MMNRYYCLLNSTTELCFNVETISSLNEREENVLAWFLSETFQPENFKKETMLGKGKIIEIGPRPNFLLPGTPMHFLFLRSVE